MTQPGCIGFGARLPLGRQHFESGQSMEDGAEPDGIARTCVIRLKGRG